ncbi:RHS repeat-associated core domain-containing protein [Kangiella sediminilitoris]|uniref:Uncharacterized protein n=1 Tax=Kangiella sediminilitoris TaxID=1144748 RepID=A0A1B3B9P0_9GAMM|nr:hypothetical protein KS2013_800 [Kangiella sediminilitoris]
MFTGEQYDPNLGFYYLRARYYNQNNGRFLSLDIYQGSRFEPQSLHKYLYTHADPVNNIDPTGKFLSSIGAGISNGIRFAATAVTRVFSGTVRTLLKFGRAGKAAVIRVKYMKRVKDLKKIEGQLRRQGKSSKEIAKVLHRKRRAIGRLFKRLTDPKTRENAFRRNMDKYGDKWGPTIKYLRDRGKSWEEIIESSTRPNSSFQELIKIFFRK